MMATAGSLRASSSIAALNNNVAVHAAATMGCCCFSSMAIASPSKLTFGTRRRCFSVVAQASPGQEFPGTGSLEAEFMRHVISSGHCWPLDNRRPTPLMPPSTVVKVQMESLMRNDWPEDNSGIKTAFDFTVPYQVEAILNGMSSLRTVRAWDASGRYVNSEEFAEFFKDSAYAPLVNCSQWKVVSPVVFTGPGDTRALQAVKVAFTTARGENTTRAFTFCLRKILIGAYEDCWLIVGARIGDYASTGIW